MEMIVAKRIAATREGKAVTRLTLVPEHQPVRERHKQERTSAHMPTVKLGRARHVVHAINSRGLG